MANLFSADLPSEDEEDQDFVPDEVDSEEEAEKRKNQAGKAKKNKNKRLRGAAAAASSDDEDDEEDEDAEPEIPEHKRAEKKAKMDDLWSQLNKQAPAAGKTGGSGKNGNGSAAGGGINLAQLCRPVTKTKASKDNAWMRQLGINPSKPSNKGKEPAKDTKSVAAAALAAASAAASATAAKQYGMVTVAETRRFAGQTITVNREVSAGSKEAAKAGADGDAAAKKKAGLDAVLESLAQAKKVTVLDKSRSDWKDFKKTDTTVEEELELHKRSGTTYLEKQEFLGRAELAEYEKERDRRLASDVRNRGRL